jgi:recombination protein RecT
MTSLKAAVTGQAPAARKPANDIAALLNDPKVKAQIALALPKHVTAERLARVALTEVRKNQALARCDQTSFLGALMTCAQLGLEPGGPLGHAYLIPFENRKKGVMEVQFIVGYRGMIDLARRSGQIVSIEARPVYEGDTFEVEFGLDSNLRHVPDFENPNRVQPEKLLFVYAVAKLKDGGVQFDVMSRREIEAVRAQSRAGTSGPWVTHFEAMALKTVVRRLFRWLPISIELAAAIEADERVDLGIPQDNPLTVDAETGEVVSQQQPQSESVLPKQEQHADQGEREESGQADQDDEWLAAYEAEEGTK